MSSSRRIRGLVGLRRGVRASQQRLVDDIGQATLQTPQRLTAGFALGLLAGQVGARSRVVAGWVSAAKYSARLRRRLPPRFSRYRSVRPDDAGIGAVPLAEATWSRVGNRWMSPTSPRIRAASTGPIPTRSTSRVRVAVTSLVSWVRHAASCS